MHSSYSSRPNHTLARAERLDQRINGRAVILGEEDSGNLLMLSRFPHRFLPPRFSTRSPKKNNGRLRMSSTSERGLCSTICTTSMTPNQSVRSANHCIVRSDKDSEMRSLTLMDSQAP